MQLYKLLYISFYIVTLHRQRVNARDGELTRDERAQKYPLVNARRRFHRSTQPVSKEGELDLQIWPAGAAGDVAEI
jgi:hypothetical protein